MFYTYRAVYKRLSIMEERTCLNCGGPLGPGRKDKKYCSEACKTEYNNNRNEQKKAAPEIGVSDYIAKVQAILTRNREILDTCLKEGNGKTKFEKRDLDGRGFIFKFITSQAPTLDGDLYNFCFEMGYKEVDNDRVIVIRREREIIC